MESYNSVIEDIVQKNGLEDSVQKGHGGLRPISIEIVKVGHDMPDAKFLKGKLGLGCLKLLSRELQIETTR